MGTCQFCGASVESIEPAAAESRQAEPPGAQPAPHQAVAAAAPTPAAETAPAADAAVPPVTTVDAAPAPAPAKRASSGVWQKYLLYYVAPVAFGMIFVLVALRVMFVAPMFGTGGDSSAPSAPPSQDATASSSDEKGASDLGVDVYPGARSTSDEDRRTLMDDTIVSKSFVSNDPTDRVIEFYKARMVGFASIYASGSSVVVSTRPSAKDSVEIAIAPAQSGGKTSISIRHTVKGGK